MTYPAVQVRRVARVVNGGTPTADEDNWNGPVPWATPIDLGVHNGSAIRKTIRTLTQKGAVSGSAIAPANSVLLSTRAPIGYSALLAVPMAFNQGCKALVPGPALSSRFLLYAIAHATEQLQAYGQGSTFSELSGSSLGSATIPLPPLGSQQIITKYLDTQTAKLDLLIGKQERLIETLAERRQAVISHAVAKGLDPNVPMKRSGTALLGEIPVTWTAMPLKRLVGRIEQGVSPVASAELADEVSWGVLKSGCLNRGVFSDEQHKRLDDDFAFAPSLRVAVGDLLVCRASGSPALVGSTAIVRRLRYQLILSDKTFRLKVNHGQNADFLEKVMNSRVYREQVLRAISGAEGLANNLPSSVLRQFIIPVPPSADQTAIVEYVNHETAQIDALSAKAREMIDVLKERRQALISAAVTGNIDVRGLS